MMGINVTETYWADYKCNKTLLWHLVGFLLPLLRRCTDKPTSNFRCCFNGLNKRTGGPEVLGVTPATSAVPDVHSVGLYCAEGKHLATVPLPFCPMSIFGVAWTSGVYILQTFCNSRRSWLIGTDKTVMNTGITNIGIYFQSKTRICYSKLMKWQSWIYKI